MRIDSIISECPTGLGQALGSEGLDFVRGKVEIDVDQVNAQWFCRMP